MATLNLTQAESLLNDPRWRLNNLYWIIDKTGEKVPFKINWAQERLYDEMWYCNLILKARQLGISTFICLLFLDRCLFNSNQYAGIIAHTREDAEAMFRRVKFAYDSLPLELKAIRKVNTDNARELQLSNGSSLRVGTSMRSSTLQYLHISELGKSVLNTLTRPERSLEIVTGSLNALAPGHYCFIESTAEGRDGYFYQMCKEAIALRDLGKKLTPLDFKMHFFPWIGEKSYRIDSAGVAVSSDLSVYFDELESKLSMKIEPEQRAWYTI